MALYHIRRSFIQREGPLGVRARNHSIAGSALGLRFLSVVLYDATS